jgi:GAF domain-containing protein
VNSGEFMIVEDARNDHRFAKMQVTSDANIGSYIGAPIVLSDGTIYGTLCAIDPQPWKFQADQVEQIVVLSRLVGFILDQERRLNAALRGRGDTARKA